MEIDRETNDLTYKIIGICMEVHRAVGPGFPEKYYQRALEIEFDLSCIPAISQRPCALLYKGGRIGMNYLDFEIDRKVILEIKSINQLTDVHLFQVLKYLAVTNLNVALLVNFGGAKLEYQRVLPTLKWQEFKKGQQING